MEQIMGRIDSAGHLVIPAAFRKRLGLKPGDEISVQLEGSTLRLMTPPELVRHSQALVAPYVLRGRSLSKELLSERRREALDE